MATTTTNYGFDVPTSSDLVKNGATAISTLGQDIDTFLFRPFTRNAIINGGADIWQRGTSFTVASNYTTYTADRFIAYRGGLNAGATLSRQATGDTTNLPFIQYCIRYQRDNGNTATGDLTLLYGIETANSISYAGKQITFSFYARKGANYSATSSLLQVRVDSGTGTDQSIGTGYTGQASVISSSATLTTTWQRFTFTGTVASTATELGFYVYGSPTGTAGAADYYEITGIQLEAGSQATPFTRAGGGTIQGELAACQRYYFSIGTGTGRALMNCSAFNSTSAFGIFRFPVVMRTAPTLEQVTGTNYFNLLGNGTTDAFDSIGAITDAYPSGCRLDITSGIAATQGYSYWVTFNNAATNVAFSAEL